ncbi:hypothetical protein RJ639_027902 [Escallonia herrerae]|uniref:Uncharacterized protein n=1 Tax=Escallonia herrerae TaxID=1293975 RepID=A0AA89BLC2_9ASTE|nr:hypothetical protein RJ639_027902 [Escallonia herrerae]
MTTSNVAKKPHAVCIPFHVQSHIKAMLKLAKLLHNKGVYITFVNTEFNHKRFLKTRGQNSLHGLPDFRFKTIPDGLPPSEIEATQDIPSLCESTRKNCLAPFLDLCGKFNQGESSNVPPLTSIVSDGFMTFTIAAAESLGVPVIHFWTLAACGFMGFYQYHILLEKGLAPLGDAGSVTNGHLDTVLDWIPGMNGIRLKDLSNLSGPVFNFVMEAAQRMKKKVLQWRAMAEKATGPAGSSSANLDKLVYHTEFALGNCTNHSFSVQNT